MTSFLRFVGTDEFKLLPTDIKVLWWVATCGFLLLPMGLSYVGIRVCRPLLSNRYARVAHVDENVIAADLANGQAVEFQWRDLVGVRRDGHLQFQGGWELWLLPPRGRVAALLSALSQNHHLQAQFDRKAKPDSRRMAAILIFMGMLGTAALAAWPPPDRSIWQTIPAFWLFVAVVGGAPLALGTNLTARLQRRWDLTLKARERANRKNHRVLSGY
jgi:hypothetical protein